MRARWKLGQAAGSAVRAPSGGVELYRYSATVRPALSAEILAITGPECGGMKRDSPWLPGRKQDKTRPQRPERFRRAKALAARLNRRGQGADFGRADFPNPPFWLCAAGLKAE